MATVKNVNDDLVICPICFEQFTNPKYLPCLHTFCQHCLKSYIVTKLGEGKKAGPFHFQCPVCRHTVTITAKVTSEQIADKLPGNHLIISLIDRLHVSQGEKSCDPCNKKNEKIIAISWCTSCEEALCDNCTTYHKHLKITKNHVTVPIDDSHKRKQLDVQEPCLKHAGNALQVYCVNHKEMCCIICLATQHRKCEQISTIEETVIGSNNDKTIESFRKHLTCVYQKTEEVKTMTENNENKLDKRYQEIINSMSTFIETTKRKIDSLHTEFKTKFQTINIEQQNKITQRKNDIETFQQTLKKGQNLIETVCDQGSQRQIFITKEKVKIQLQDNVESLKKDFGQVEFSDYRLDMDNVLKSVASLTSVAKVGLITCDSSGNLKSLVNAVGDLFNEELEGTALRKNIGPIDIKTIRITKEQIIQADGGFMGGTYLPDGRVVVCNFNYTKLCAYENGKLLFEHSSLKDRPLDACYIQSSEILVSFHNGCYITKFEVAQNAFKVKNVIQCHDKPSGLAATKSNIFVGFTEKVAILDLNGNFMKIFSHRKYEWLCPVSTSLSSNIYYSDGDHVVCKSSNGEDVAKFISPDLKRPFGIAVDVSGNVYCCGHDSRNVYAFSSDGKIGRQLVEKVSPQGISLDYTGKKFFVATETGIEFYNLKLK